MLYTKLDSIELIKTALTYFGKSEVFEELTEDEWLMVPYFLSVAKDGEIFVTDSVNTGKDLEVDYKLLKEDIEVHRYNKRFIGYIGMPLEYYTAVGESIELLYTHKGETHTNIGVMPEGMGFTGILPTITRGNIVTFCNPFGDIELLKKTFGIHADTFVVTASNGGYYATCQVRGTKSIKDIPYVFLKHVGDIVRFKAKPITFNDVTIDSEEVTQKVFKWYRDNGHIIDNSFKKLMVSWTSRKLEYQNFLFRDGINYNMNKDIMFQQKCVKLHPKYKEMIEVLKELGIDVEAQKENIFNNVLIVNGARKPKTVTGFIQTHKKVRYDNVYSEAKELFKENICLSIDPYEFVTASHNTNRNSRDLSSSCFRLNGQYHAAVWAYVQSEQTIILKIKDSSGCTSFRMWCAFDVASGGIMFGRHYGTLNDYQYKVIRYVLEEKFSDFLNLPNSWVSGSREINIDYSDRNTYFDTPQKVVLSRSIGASEFSLSLGEGLDGSGDASYEGYFTTGHYCDCCGSNGHDEVTYVEGYDNVCNDCLSDDFRYSEEVGGFIHNDDAIFIEDLGTWVRSRDARDYYEYNDCYYKEIPDNVVFAEDTDDLRDIDDCWCCEESGNWYYHTSSQLELVSGGFIHEDNIDDYKFCPKCEKWFRDTEDCPDCIVEVA